jgi:hypothetical protein
MKVLTTLPGWIALRYPHEKNAGENFELKTSTSEQQQVSSKMSYEINFSFGSQEKKSLKEGIQDNCVFFLRPKQCLKVFLINIYGHGRMISSSLLALSSLFNIQQDDDEIILKTMANVGK